MTSILERHKVCSSDCVRWTHLEQIFVSSSPPRKCIGTMLGGVHHLNSRAAASPFIFIRFTIASIALLYCRGKKLWLCMTNALGSNFCQLLPTQEVHWYHVLRRSLFNSRAAASPLIFNRSTIAAIVLVYWRSKKVCSYNIRTWNKFLSAPHHPKSALVPCLEVFFVQTAGQQHPLWYSIRWHHQIYRGEAKRSVALTVHDVWTWNKFLSAPHHPGSAFGTMLGGIYHSYSRATVSPLIFYYSCHSTSILERQKGV